MLYELEIAHDDMDILNIFSYFFDRFNFMQYINRKDKNKKEIYDGDIVGSKNGWKEIIDMEDRATILYISKVCNDIKIIGNIYENPEL